MRAQFNISPSTHDVSDINVFVSYRTGDWDSAKDVAEAITTRGLNVKIIDPPTEPQTTRPQEEVRTWLSEELADADYICLINTKEAHDSEWVAYEFVTAGLIVGRVVFVNIGAAISGYDAADTFLERAKEHSHDTLYVKHTTVPFPDSKPETIDLLVKEMMNDPDCGWTDSRNQTSFNPFPPRDELKSHLNLQKAARESVLNDHQFAEHHIIEVIPFLASQNFTHPSITNPSEHLQSILLERGMLNLLDDLASAKIDVSRVKYSCDPQLDQSSEFYAYVVREHHESRLALPDLDIFAPFQKFVSDPKHRRTIQVDDVKRSPLRHASTENDQNGYTDPRDQEQYRTVTIEGKTWFAENLRFSSERSCYYNNDASRSTKYGRLYSWDDAVASTPPGWRLPTNDDWCELAVHLGGFLDTDDTGFGDAEKSYAAIIEGGQSGLDIGLAGFKYYDGTFKYLNVDGYYWALTEYNQDLAIMFYFLGGAEETRRGSAFKTAGQSVRCVREANSSE